MTLSPAIADTTPYQPRMDLISRVRRRSARVLAKDVIRPQLSRGIVSLTFDDCPVSVRDTALPMMEAKGWRGTIYACFGLAETVNHLGAHMSAADYVAAHRKGHEIGDHTFSHLDGLAVGPHAMRADIARNREAMRAVGIPAPTTFAYPYGEVTPALKRALRPEFDLLRGIHDPRSGVVDLALAASQRLYNDTVDDVLSAINRAAEAREWLILFSHDVRTDCSKFGCTPDQFGRVIAALSAADVDVLPVANALERVR